MFNTAALLVSAGANLCYVLKFPVFNIDFQASRHYIHLFHFSSSKQQRETMNCNPSNCSNSSNQNIYSPLNESENEFRLLRILPSSSFDASIECRLSTHSLKQSTQFIAFSYVWGDASDTEEIVVNGQRKSVTRNLFQLLQHARFALVSEHNDPPFWINALCINQADVSERNHQVQLMGSIYSSSFFVVAWLCPEDEPTQHAIQLLEAIGKAMLPHNQEEVQLRGDPEYDEEDWMEEYPEFWTSDESEPILNKFWSALCELLSLPYWTRVWTFQEMVLAQRLNFMIGLKFLAFDRLALAFNWFLRMRTPGRTRPPFVDPFLWGIITSIELFPWNEVAGVHRHRESRRAGHHPNLGLVQSSLTFSATDPRDKVYGLLGLVKTAMVPDYTSRLLRFTPPSCHLGFLK